MKPVAQIHPTADVSPEASIGEGTRIWHQAQVREGACVGSQCVLGKGVYVDRGVQIGSKVKIQNCALIYEGATLEDGVFIGPQVCLANDRLPRAVTPEGVVKGEDDWERGTVVVCFGASLGAAVVVLPGVTIGRFALVGAGAVVTRDVPDHGFVVGNPARLEGYVCRCARRLAPHTDGAYWCAACQERYELG